MNNNGTGISQDHNITNALSLLRFCFIQDARAHARISGESEDNLTPRQSFWLV